MDFAESLPDACPPSDAQDVELNDVFRLAPEETPCLDHFRSHAALGKNPPKYLNDHCRWASCSLTTDPQTLRKLSKLKHRYAVKMSIPEGAGLSKRDKIHIDFWRSSAFDPLAAIVGLEEF